MEIIRSILEFSRGISGEFTRKNFTLPRFTDETETLLSVFLAIVLAHLLGAENIGWAAFTGYMIMRAHLLDTFIRGTLRMTGTGVGALLAYHTVIQLGHSIPLTAALTALVGALALYLALTSRFGYAWLFMGITYAMVSIDSLGEPYNAVYRFALTRTIEVLAGTIACITVSICSNLIKPKLKIIPGKIGLKRAETFPGYRIYCSIHALQAGLVLFSIPFLKDLFNIGDLSQAAVTALAVLTVPLASITNPLLVSRRNIHRFTGCLLGATLAIGFLPLFNLHILITGVLLCIGVYIGRHIENSGKPFAYVGAQFALVYLVISVPDSLTHFSAEPGLSRLLGILIGICLVELTRVLTIPLRKSLHP